MPSLFQTTLWLISPYSYLNNLLNMHNFSYQYGNFALFSDFLNLPPPDRQSKIHRSIFTIMNLVAFCFLRVAFQLPASTVNIDALSAGDFILLTQPIHQAFLTFFPVPTSMLYHNNITSSLERRRTEGGG